MEQIRQQLEVFAKMDDADWHFFSSKLEKAHCTKKSIILKENKVENYLSYIEEGIIRLYIPKLENDVTFGFVFSGNFVSAYDSFLTQTPCSYQLQALTQTTLWRISYKDLQEVYAKTKIGNVIGRKNAENLFLIKSNRELSLLNDTPEQRYLNLFKDRPDVIKQIPLKYIASYIGVTPQALSRIRKRIS